MAHIPPQNHWWHVTLYVSARGLTTSLIPDRRGGFEIAFDFGRHRLQIHTVDGRERTVALEHCTVADFFAETMARLSELSIDAPITPWPVEVEDATPFPDDHHHATHDPDAAARLWRTLVEAHRTLAAFRAGFAGKTSPVHFFWGSFDLAVTRFSGRPAPLHPGGAPNCPDWVMHEAYSQEVSSAGFWPSGGTSGLFYSYAYPEPDSFARTAIAPAAAQYDSQLREFVLPYDTVRTATDPDAAVADFLTSTYQAAADRGGWDRARLEMPLDTEPPWTYQPGTEASSPVPEQ
jgi:hypothetical protein